ncbi:hypothetical protein ABT369_55995 [Dactylosporangium sp. NPDC000244]|uniref:hypothetical protein n=1 Tax=Dactylosporangium sp. NPDC000244 TaxID=3154365 RepID=UPI0033321E1A
MTTKPHDTSTDGVTPLIALANVALVGVPAAYASTGSILITALAALAALAASVIVLAYLLCRLRCTHAE